MHTKLTHKNYTMCFYEYVCSILVSSPGQLVLPFAKQPLPDKCKVSDDTYSYLWALHVWWENPLAFASTFCSLYLVFYSVTHCSSLFKILIIWYLLAAISNYTQHIFKAISACTCSLSRMLRSPGINVSTWAYACKMPELLNFWQWPTYWNRWSGSHSESLHRCWFTHNGIA